MKTKAHTIYKNHNGDRIPGVTTILGLLAKPQLIKWANNLGLQGIDSNKYVDELASIGTLIHYLIECDLKRLNPELNDYTPNQIKMAQNGFNKWIEWKSKHSIVVIESELKLISDRYGGCCDLYCVLDGVNTVLDFKTGKGIYDEYLIQTSAYAKIIGDDVDQVAILNIGRDENEPTREAYLKDFKKHQELFEKLVDIYYLRKELGMK